jgi:hypothetical protein
MNATISHLRYIVAALIIIVITTVYTYLDIGDHEFLAWDDIEHVVQNKHLAAVNIENLIWIFTSLDQIMWHPVTSLSHMLTLATFGKNPLIFKIFNILVHICNSILVFFVTKKILSILAINNTIFRENIVNPHYLIFLSFLASLSFAIHPTHIESVIWITERKDVLCALFFYSGIFSYLRYIETKNNSWRHITLLFCVLALASKTMAVTFPFVLIFLDLFILYKLEQDMSWRNNLLKSAKDKILMIFTTVGFSVVALFTQDEAIQDLNALGTIPRIANAIESLSHYFFSILAPIQVSPYYPLPDYSLYPIALTLVKVVCFTLIIYVLIRLYNRGVKTPLFAFMYFVITILPVLGIIKIGHAAYADRYTYIPSLSLHIFLGAVLGSMIIKPKNKIIQSTNSIIVLVYVLALISVSKIYISDWANDEALWTKVIRLNPYKSDVAYLNYGNIIYRKNGCTNAVSLYHFALAVNPTQLEALVNLAKCHNDAGNNNLARYYYNLLAKRNPNSTRANLLAGDYFYNSREFLLADSYYRKALKISPGSATVIFKNAVIDYISFRKNSARIKLDYIFKLDPAHLGALQLKTKIEYDDGNLTESLLYAQKVLAIDSKDQFANHVIKSTHKNTSIEDG